MITELRRSKRFADFLPITVSAVSGSDDKVVAGPFSGRIIDISRHGACLLMTQVLLKTFHIFHSTLKQESNYLLLRINIPPDLVNFSMPAMPVWMGPYVLDEIKVYRMGVEFLTGPEGEQMQRLEKVMQKKQSERDDLWNSVSHPYLQKHREE
ncbi:MAG TPA: PilZ domain-containing protein [Desulfobacteraceae bacterium]|nr:PilZ domain-containing protein [Desulfobacteraceae bacterium]